MEARTLSLCGTVKYASLTSSVSMAGMSSSLRASRLIVANSHGKSFDTAVLLAGLKMSRRSVSNHLYSHAHNRDLRNTCSTPSFTFRRQVRTNFAGKALDTFT